jgi:hypothetical protein
VIERNSGERPTGKPKILAIVGTLVAPVILYFVVRSAAVAMSPAAAALLPPANSSATLRAMVSLAADPRHRVSDEVRIMALDGAVSAPLAFEPYFIEAKVHEQSGRLESAIRLMEEARRRRPSFVLTRLHLVAYYQQARRYGDLLHEMDFVLRKSPEANRYILPELVRLIGDPTGRSALASILARDPEWKGAFFEAARARQGRPEDALALLNLAQARRNGGNLTLERGLYLQRLVQAGDYPRARAVWLQMRPPMERAQYALLFNGSFRSVQAEPPFAWSFPQDAAGRAEIVATGTSTPYLDALYYGGSNATLAEQTLALPPGRYRLSHIAKSAAGVRSGELAWIVSCLSDNRELGRLRLVNLAPAYRRYGIDFVVPAGCSGQRLHLGADAGDIAAEVNVQIARLEIGRGG